MPGETGTRVIEEVIPGKYLGEWGVLLFMVSASGIWAAQIYLPIHKLVSLAEQAGVENPENLVGKICRVKKDLQGKMRVLGIAEKQA